MKGIQKIIVGAVCLTFIAGSESSFAKEGTAGCKYRHVQECKDITANNKKDPDGINTQYCNYFESHDMGCKQELWSATAYTTVAAVCLTACVLEKTGYGTAAAQALRPVCTWGSLGVAAADIASTLIISGEIKKKTQDAHKNLPVTYGLKGGSVASAVGAGLATLLTTGGTIGGLANKTVSSAELCAAAVMDGMFAYSKWKNKSVIVKAAEKNYCQLKENLDGKDYGCNSLGNFGNINFKPTANLSQFQTNLTSNTATAPDLSGLEGLSSEADDMKNMPIDEAVKNMNEAYAKAGDDKILGKPNFSKALKALKDVTGADPNAFLASAARGNLSDTMSKLLGNMKGDDFGMGLVKESEKLGARLRIEGQTNIAFEKPVSNSNGTNKKFSNFGSDLFGDRGPAGVGGADKLIFGGFDGDIWHVGTTQSIFEIVSKKTNAVSNRVVK